MPRRYVAHEERMCEYESNERPGEMWAIFADWLAPAVGAGHKLGPDAEIVFVREDGEKEVCRFEEKFIDKVLGRPISVFAGDHLTILVDQQSLQ